MYTLAFLLAMIGMTLTWYIDDNFSLI